MPNALTWLFIAALLAATATRLWLGRRQIRHVNAHRDAVPPSFAESIPLSAHQKAADYTTAKTRLGTLELLIGALTVLVFTLGGLIQWLSDAWSRAFDTGSIAHGTALLLALFFLQALIGLPLSVYRTFGIETRFGFNRMTLRLYIIDLIKHTLVALVLGVPLLLAVLWLMGKMGAYWWLYVWIVWVAYSVLLMMIYPALIMPLFNKFTPITEGELATRVARLLERCGFRSSGLYLMDGSRRSSHGNAFFTGFGAAKRIVLFDTLVSRLQPPEVEAVLAHELGHYRLHHIAKAMVLSAAISFAVLWLLGQLIDQPWFYAGLGVATPSHAAALALFLMALPEFLFFLQPLTSRYSRKREFEADTYARQHASSNELVRALVKLYQDNAATLTPDPVHSAFYDSHPPAAVRIARLGDMSKLTSRKCKPCEGGVAPYTASEAKDMLKQLKGWVIADARLVKVYPFTNYYQTMAFVNALAWISHREDHHPDLAVGYNKCRVEYSTHAIGGLSENDFICAAKCDALFDL